jgi:pantothenate kinase-related protein Tda10
MKQKQQNPLFVGALGVQGAGKTTFGEIIKYIANEENKKLISVSIDDFYLNYEKRIELKK